MGADESMTVDDIVWFRATAAFLRAAPEKCELGPARYFQTTTKERSLPA